jgi:hypothetical protein
MTIHTICSLAELHARHPKKSKEDVNTPKEIEGGRQQAIQRAKKNNVVRSACLPRTCLEESLICKHPPVVPLTTGGMLKYEHIVQG